MVSARERAKQAREAVRVQREMLAKQRADAERATKVLEEQKAKIPPITQKNLRVGNLAGLSGLRRRTIYSGMRKDIEQRQGNISLLMKELARYEEEELSPYEKEIDAYERAIKKASRTTYYSAPKTSITTKVTTTSTISPSGFSSVAKPSSTTFTVSTPSKITLPSSILNSNKTSNVIKKKSLFSWRK